MMRFSAIAAVICLAALAGCCVHPPVTPIKSLPPVISLGEQLGLLNARAHALANVRAGGTVVIRYVDEKGEQKQQSADGRLLVRQRYGAEGLQDPGDLWLSGRVMAQEVFQAGKNQQKWWFYVVPDVNTAWVGDVQGPENLSQDVRAIGGAGGVMRADMVLPVLGITEIQPHPGETVAMLVNDDQRTNNLLIVKQRPDGTGWVKREIVVNRDTGNVSEVRLYNAAGVAVVRAELSDYRPAEYREGEDPPPGFVAPKFPYDIKITYLGEKTSVHFVLTGEEGKKAELVTSLPQKPFETPTFEGMKVVDLREH